MTDIKKDGDLKKGVSVILLALFIITVGAFIQNGVRSFYATKEAPTPTPTIQIYRGVTCPKDFAVFNEENKQTIDLISEPKVMFAKNGEFVNYEVVVTKKENKESKVACGYIYVKAHTNDGALKTWEDVYINPNSFGGHIDKSNQFGLGDGNNASQYLFSLGDIKYWETIKTRGVILSADWASLLNVSDKVSFQIALNTQDKSGTIDKVSIYYKCLNPSTGQENTDCKLQILSSDTKNTGSLR